MTVPLHETVEVRALARENDSLRGALARRDETISRQRAMLDQRDAALEELSGQYERMHTEVKRLRRELREADETIEWHAQAEGLS